MQYVRWMIFVNQALVFCRGLHLSFSSVEDSYRYILLFIQRARFKGIKGMSATLFNWYKFKLMLKCATPRIQTLSLSLSRTFSIEILVYLYSFSYFCVFNMQWETQIVSQYIDRTLRCLIPNHFFLKNTWIKKEQPTAMQNSQSKRFFSYRIIFNYLNGSLCFWSLTLKYHLNNPQNLQSMH